MSIFPSSAAPIEGSFAVFLLRPGSWHPSFEQQFHHRAPALRGCPEQRRVTVVVLGLNVCAFL